MAEEKEKKSPQLGFERLIAELFGIFILMYIVYRLVAMYRSGNGIQASISSFFERMGLKGLYDTTAFAFIFFSSLLSILFISGILYCLLRLHQLESEIELPKWYHNLTWWGRELPRPANVNAAPSADEAHPKNERWNRVIQHISSSNASDWRLAILECDIILDELLDKIGYVGGTIGDKLKNADPAHFRTLDNAWEAHKIRNAIAHEGQDFTLTQREARRIIGLYETVFREFEFI